MNMMTEVFKIKRVATAFICVLVIGIMSACGSSYESSTDAAMETLVKAIEDEDKEAILSLFSEAASEEADELDERAEKLIALGNGKIDNWERVSGYEDASKDGNSIVKKKGNKYSVTIDEEEYIFFLVDCIEDSDNPRNVGIYMIQALHTDNFKANFDWGHEKICSGIYPVIGKGE